MDVKCMDKSEYISIQLKGIKRDQTYHTIKTKGTNTALYTHH